MAQLKPAMPRSQQSDPITTPHPGTSMSHSLPVAAVGAHSLHVATSSSDDTEYSGEGEGNDGHIATPQRPASSGDADILWMECCLRNDVIALCTAYGDYACARFTAASLQGATESLVALPAILAHPCSDIWEGLAKCDATLGLGLLPRLVAQRIGNTEGIASPPRYSARLCPTAILRVCPVVPNFRRSQSRLFMRFLVQWETTALAAVPPAWVEPGVVVGAAVAQLVQCSGLVARLGAIYMADLAHTSAGLRAMAPGISPTTEKLNDKAPLPPRYLGTLLIASSAGAV